MNRKEVRKYKGGCKPMDGLLAGTAFQEAFHEEMVRLGVATRDSKGSRGSRAGAYVRGGGRYGTAPSWQSTAFGRCYADRQPVYLGRHWMLKVSVEDMQGDVANAPLLLATLPEFGPEDFTRDGLTRRLFTATGIRVLCNLLLGALK